MSQLLKTSKALYGALLNPDGTWAEKPHGILQRKDLLEDHLRFLRRYLEFMLHSKLLNDAAKIYIKSPYMTAKAAFIEYNTLSPDKARPVATLVSSMDYCRKKVLKDVFPDNMLYHVIELPHKADMPHYWELLNRAMEKYSQPSLLADTVTLKLSKRVASSAPTESRLAECLLALSPYRRTVHKRCESEMQEKYGEVIGYISYLSSCVERTPEENRLFNAVSDFLNGDTTALVRLKRRGR